MSIDNNTVETLSLSSVFNKNNIKFKMIIRNYGKYLPVQYSYKKMSNNNIIKIEILVYIGCRIYE